MESRKVTMPEQAEFVADDTGAEVRVPYIQYAPWEPKPVPASAYDLRTLGDKVTELQAEVARLHALLVPAEGDL